MKGPSSGGKANRRIADASPPHSPAGENALALAPPDYGIDFVDGGMPAAAPAAAPASAPPPSSQTGLPARLAAGIESLSGMDLSDVRVNFNSGKPAQLDALAYTQGNEIHLASGQERHLPHEAWH